MRRLVLAALPTSALLAACRGGSVPNQVLTKPAAVPAPAPAVRTAGPWSYRPSSQRQAFVVDLRALVAVRTDTSTRTDTVSSHAELSFTAAASSGSVSGSVTAFLVQGTVGTAATPAGLAPPFPLRAQYAERASQLVFTVPRDAAPCSSSALAVAQSLRDVWFRPPDTLHIGTAWQDSSTYIVCRDGIPLQAAVRRSFTIIGVTAGSGRQVLTVSRISHTTIEGSGAQFGEGVSVSGTGNGQLDYSLDPASGEVLSATGGANLELSLRSRLRSQVVRQTVEIRIGRS